MAPPPPSDLSADAVIDDHGNVRVTGKRYRDVTFETLNLTVTPAQRAVLTDVTFEQCRTRAGFFLTPSTTLRDVTFLDLDCGDALHVHARTVLERVTVAGTRPRMLWIRPWATRATDPPGDDLTAPVLDIAHFTGEVSITGVLTHEIVLDPARQVRVPRTLLDDVDWAALGLARTSTWRIAARKVAADGSPDGVFSIPAPTSKAHEPAVRDLAVLRAHGCLVPPTVA